jgi:GNAT superfamily N-acetyltransferase
MAARLATPVDAAEFVRLRALMLTSMGQVVDDHWAPVWEIWFAEMIASGRGFGAVVDRPDGRDRLAATGFANEVDQWPGPADLAGRGAWISGMSTDPHWRRQGFGRAVLNLLLTECRTRGLATVRLNATPDGQPLYESVGFRPGRFPQLRLELERETMATS